MSILKKRIERSINSHKSLVASKQTEKTPVQGVPKRRRTRRLTHYKYVHPANVQKRNRVLGIPLSTYHVLSSKNIVKNFGRAIANFICTKVANPYIDDLILAKQIGIKSD